MHVFIPNTGVEMLRSKCTEVELLIQDMVKDKKVLITKMYVLQENNILLLII